MSKSAQMPSKHDVAVVTWTLRPRSGAASRMRCAAFVPTIALPYVANATGASVAAASSTSSTHVS